MFYQNFNQVLQGDYRMSLGQDTFMPRVELVVHKFTNPELKQTQREYWEKEVAKFKKQGNEITQIPRGQSGYKPAEMEYASKGRQSKGGARQSTTVYRTHEADTYEGKPCKKCGLKLRYVSNSACVDCAKSRKKNVQAKSS